MRANCMESVWMTQMTKSGIKVQQVEKCCKKGRFRQWRVARTKKRGIFRSPHETNYNKLRLSPKKVPDNHNRKLALSPKDFRDNEHKS
mgnify:CR=1 FL=1